ncbi:hypothetical protein Tco_0635125 [Tanacetum coccineum]
MTTARDTQPPYQTTASAGGKLRKAPLQRRNIPCAPAITKKNPNLLTKIVDRASKLFRVVFGNRNPSETSKQLWASIYVNRDYSGGRATRSEIEWLKALLHSNPYCSPSFLLRLEASTSGSLKKHGDERDNLHAITTPMVTSRVLEEEIASPVELAKAYMGSRPSKAALRQDLGIKSSYGREEALTSSQSSAFQHGGKMALKRRSSILDDDIGSGGPLRRTRQKANLALKRRSSVLDDDIGSGGPLCRI